MDGQGTFLVAVGYEALVLNEFKKLQAAPLESLDFTELLNVKPGLVNHQKRGRDGHVAHLRPT